MLPLKEKYKKEVIPKMMEKFGYKNILAVPRIEKIICNCGFGKIISGKTSSEKEKIINTISELIALIAGQKPALTKARKSIASFKLRKGTSIGFKTTLRKKKMFDFLERLIWITLPRIRDFRGIPLSLVDKKGNLTLGFKDFSAFPEIIMDKEKGIFGLEITVVTNTNDREKGIELLRLIGFPLKSK